MDSDDEVSSMEQENMDVVGDAESILGDLPMIETPNATINDEIVQEKIFFRGIWWVFSWTQNWDLYDDYDYWRSDGDTIMGREDLEDELRGR